MANDVLFARLEDLALRAEKTGFAASKFLTPAESAAASAYFTRKQSPALTFDGGFEDAERTRAVFSDAGRDEITRSGLFSALKIDHRQQDAVGHRDILGALMALGVERNTIGDIVLADNCAFLVCLPELGAYITDNLKSAGRVGVMVSQIALGGLPVVREQLLEKTTTVASPRLDAVLGAAFGLSRSKASELILCGRVSLNHQLCLQPAKEISEGSLLSVRGLGRAKLLEAGGLSKKGRVFIRIGLFGR